MPLFPSTVKHTQITLAGNKVNVKIPAVSAAALGANVRANLIYKVTVYIEEVKGSGKFIIAGQKISHEKAPRTKNDVTYLDGCSIDISDILQAYIPDGVYNLDQYVTTTYTYSKPSEYLATLKYYYTTECVTLATSPASSSIFTAINGKLSKRKFAAWKNIFFTSRMDDLGNFLTWSPATKYVSKTQNEYLFFLQNFNPSTLLGYIGFEIKHLNGLILNYQYAYSPGDLSLIRGIDKVHVIPCGFTQLNISYLWATHNGGIAAYPVTGTDADILGYSISFWGNLGAGDVRVSEEKNYKLKSASKYTARFVSFRNSLGTYDTLACEGKSTESAKVARATVEKAIENDGLPTLPELETVAVDGIHEITLNTGYMEGYSTDYLLELLYSDDIRLQTDEGLIPIQLVTDELIYKDETEFLKQRTFQFHLSNTEIAGSFLGVAPAIANRPTAWSGIEPFCQVNDFGIYNGQMKFNSLELRYADGAQEVVEGAQPKLNIEGTEGYIASIASPQCLAALTPITNAVQSRLGTYKKNTCVAPEVGDYPTITIAAGTYGGATLSQANQRALDAIAALDTQDYANSGAGAAACITGPWAYSMAGIPSNKFNLRWGQRVQGNLTGIQGGPGASSGNPTELIYGNYWVVFQSTNSGSIYFGPQLFDNLLPTAPGGSGVYEIIVHTTTPKVLNLYKNGTLVLTNTITSGDLGTNFYKKINLTGMTYATGDRYYADII